VPDQSPHARLVLTVTRRVLPLVIAIVGVAGIIAGRGHTAVAGAGVVLLGIALIVWMINWLFRMSLASNKERDVEERAREYFDEHGRWPDEAGR
jgi:O-antigen/teichoic acid export membrane protein